MVRLNTLTSLLVSVCITVPALSAPAFADPWVVGEQPRVWSTNQLGDGSNPQGGVPPYFANMPADIPSNFDTSQWSTITTTELPDAKTKAQGGHESKARFDCNFTGTGKADPILAQGVADFGHWHTFLGNVWGSENPTKVTYASLRVNGTVACYAGKLNRTLYWEPTLYKKVNNIDVGIKPLNIITYYVCGKIEVEYANTDGPTSCTVWPRGFNFIDGFNLFDPTNSKFKADIANSPGYSEPYPGSPTINWSCATPVSGDGSVPTSPIPGGKQPWLRNKDGSPTLNCAPNTPIILNFVSQPCWDGKNPSSPDGRRHMSPPARKNADGKLYCPDKFFHVVQFIANINFLQTGQDDYTNWWFSSDRMGTDPSQWYRNGESGHFDLIPAWDYGTTSAPGTFLKFVNRCLGARIDLGVGPVMPAQEPRECGYGGIGPYERTTVFNSPDGSKPDPVVTLAPNQTGYLRYIPLKKGENVSGGMAHDRH